MWEYCHAAPRLAPEWLCDVPGPHFSSISVTENFRAAQIHQFDINKGWNDCNVKGDTLIHTIPWRVAPCNLTLFQVIVLLASFTVLLFGGFALFKTQVKLQSLMRAVSSRNYFIFDRTTPVNHITAQKEALINSWTRGPCSRQWGPPRMRRNVRLRVLSLLFGLAQVKHHAYREKNAKEMSFVFSLDSQS